MTTTSDLIDKVASATQLGHDDVKSMLAAMSEAILGFCTELDAVAVPGFGTFTPVKTDELIVTDAATGARTLLPPRVDVRFKSSVVLRKKFIG